MDRAARPNPDADGPLSELIPYALDQEEDLKTPQEDMRLQARDLVLAEEHTSYWAGMDAGAEGPYYRVVPPTDGSYITDRRRCLQTSARFLQSLEDEAGLDLDTKHRLLASAVRLVRDICEARETVDWATHVKTRHESNIYYKRVSIMRPPFDPMNPY